MRYFIIIFIVVSLGVGCKEETFVDEALLDEWKLEYYIDSLGTPRPGEPIDLPQPIELIFRQDCKISGQISSFDIDGSYTIDEMGSMDLNLTLPDAPVCCQWDEYFLDRYETIYGYEIVGGDLRLLFGVGEEAMILTNEKIPPYFDENLIGRWQLERHEDINGNVLHEKPEDLEHEIVLDFRPDFLFICDLAGWISYGSYSVDEENKMDFSYTPPFIVGDSEWNELFLASYISIDLYEKVGFFLKLHYYGNSKVLVFKRQ